MSTGLESKKLMVGRVVGGMFITVTAPVNDRFEVIMCPIFTDNEGTERVLMYPMYKKSLRAADIQEMHLKFNEFVDAAEGQNIRDLIQVTRVGNVEICIGKDFMSYEVIYNDAKYMTICDELEKGHAKCYFATRKAPQYIAVKRLGYFPGLSPMHFIFSFFETL